MDGYRQTQLLGSAHKSPDRLSDDFKSLGLSMSPTTASRQLGRYGDHFLISAQSKSGLGFPKAALPFICGRQRQPIATGYSGLLNGDSRRGPKHI
jgi:hypothetical protein